MVKGIEEDAPLGSVAVSVSLLILAVTESIDVTDEFRLNEA